MNFLHHSQIKKTNVFAESTTEFFDWNLVWNTKGQELNQTFYEISICVFPFIYKQRSFRQNKMFSMIMRKCSFSWVKHWFKVGWYFCCFHSWHSIDVFWCFNNPFGLGNLLGDFSDPLMINWFQTRVLRYKSSTNNRQLLKFKAKLKLWNSRKFTHEQNTRTLDFKILLKY